MHTKRVYTLSFVSRDASLSRVPEIVFTMPKNMFLDAVEDMRIRADRNAEGIQQYLDLKKRPVCALREKGFLGYKSCCRIEYEGRTTRLYVELRRRHHREIVATCAIFLSALRSCKTGEGEDALSPPGQLMDLDTGFGDSFHSHAIGGEVYPPFGKWLRCEARAGKGKAIEARVVLAMREAWRAVAPQGTAHYMSECGFRLHEDGRPSFGCFGDACDVAVYPDGLFAEMGSSIARLDSHNLDSSAQQITFLAGLAELWGMCARDIAAR